MDLKATQNSHINQYGQDVTITYKTLQLDSKGKKVVDSYGHDIFTEGTVTTKARIKVLNGTERIVNNTDLQANDAIGYFKLSDLEYLNQNSLVSLDFGNGIVYSFQMLLPIPRMGHVEVPLRRREI